MPYTRVFEDFDTPGEGQPYYIHVFIDLVDAQTKAVVREAYFEGRTIAGVTKAPIDGGSINWWNQSLARAQWELPLAPNSEIVYKGTPGGTFWRRRVESRSPYASPAGTIKPTRAYIDVPPLTDVDPNNQEWWLGRQIFGDLVAPDDEDQPVTDQTWNIVAGDLWTTTLTFSNPDPNDPEVQVPVNKAGYTMELELRRSFRDTVRATATFDYTDATSGKIGMSLLSATTAPLFGTYIGSLQETDSSMERTTLSTWSFIFGPDR